MDQFIHYFFSCVPYYFSNMMGSPNIYCEDILSC